MSNDHKQDERRIENLPLGQNIEPIDILTAINGRKIIKNRHNNFPQNIALKSLAK